MSLKAMIAKSIRLVSCPLRETKMAQSGYNPPVERLSDYDYVLPEDRIAQTPLEDRSASKLLHLDLRSGEIHDRVFREVEQILKPGDLLVRNNTRVTARRLFGEKPTGGLVEMLVLSRQSPDRFVAMLRPAKRLKPGAKISLEQSLEATVLEDLGDGLKLLEVMGADSVDWSALGQIPLPPYIHSLLQDQERYQTVYASQGGSAAAPTAGLHFTEDLVRRLEDRGVEVAEVTLDVSLDTFRPIQVENLEEHQMHGETCRVPVETVKKVESATGRIVAVGTTTVRTLESFATGKRQLNSGEMRSKLFIRPGFEFQIIDGIFTNFHMPKTSMLLMISALAGLPNIRRAYSYALENQYRFLSFGDSMLLL